MAERRHGTCAFAAVATTTPDRVGSAAAVESRTRRLMREEGRVGFMYDPLERLPEIDVDDRLGLGLDIDDASRAIGALGLHQPAVAQLQDLVGQ